jgi:iron(III) transport system substrate-binding protein
MATIIKMSSGSRGMEYLRRLSALKPGVRKGHVLLASLVAAGEVPVGLAMYHGNVEAMKRKGAPIDFVPVQPVIARPQGIGVARSAPHPYAALLLADYVLSPVGQRLFESLGRVPASTRVKSELNNFPFTVIDPVTVLDEADKWEKLWSDLFLKP